MRSSATQVALVFLELLAGQETLAIHPAGTVETDVIGLLLAVPVEDVVVTQARYHGACRSPGRLTADAEHACLRHAGFHVPYQRLVAIGDSVDGVLHVAGAADQQSQRSDEEKGALEHVRASGRTVMLLWPSGASQGSTWRRIGGSAVVWSDAPDDVTH